ncbi:MAG: enoyl-[acyl-carrier-protein] reductase FabL [Planctomycetota bacterium]|jgi:enoyl-[acyl-carrier protein] reductase III
MSAQSPIDLTGKFALVTGGSRGIGRAISKLLASNGAQVAFNYLRNREAAAEAKAEIASVGLEPIEIRANVADEDHVNRMFDEIKEKFGRLDILVSNAALGVLKPVTELREKDWRWTMDINARALVKLARHSIELMGDRGGSIVGVSSLGSTHAIPFYGAVGASKAALESLVRHLAIENAEKGIRVNVVSGGAVDTDALKFFPNREEILEDSLKRTPAGRLVTPEDMADAVLFLVSDLAKMVHGQTLIVDGGTSIVA